MMSLAVQEFLRESPVRNEYRDDDWTYIMFQYAMNYSLKTLKDGYREYKQKQAQAVSAEDLRMLGYSEEDIQRSL